MKPIRTFSAAGAALVLSLLDTAPAAAEPMRFEAVMSPTEQMRLDFQDGSNHFLLLVRREGTASGSAPFDGATVVEYGAHDIIPGVGGDPRGYLEITGAGGDIAYVKWQVRAVFVPGENGRPMLLDNGFWEIVGGTGRHEGLKGAGIMHIKAENPTDRRFILEGDIFPEG